MNALLNSLEHDAEAFRLRKELEEQGFHFADYKDYDDART